MAEQLLNTGSKTRTNALRLNKTIKLACRNYELYLFLLPALVYYVIFCYWPMYGLQIAFKDFTASLGILTSPWVGLKHFRQFINTPRFWMLIQNTLGISVYSLLVGFPAPILLALVLNEQKSRKLKRIVQTVSYAPHFISTVVMVSLLMIILRTDYGILNKLLGLLGVPSQDYLSNPNLFKSIYVFSGIWQSAGWGSIIYLASLAGVDPELHEAAMIDGASRLERIWYINLPGILPTIVIMFIITAGNLMSVGFEKAFLMQNPLNLEASEVISTYIYKVGLMQVRYSFSSAVGLFNSVINCILLVAVNTFSRRLGDTSLW